MDEDRLVISDELRAKIAPLLPGKAGDPGATGRDNRRFMEAVLWRVRTGSPWRDLPQDFGNWNSVFKRFRRWAKAGVFERLFNAISDEPDLEHALIDGTIVQAHQKASGAKGDTASSHWTLSRRADDQNRCPGRCARQLVPLSASAGASARHEGGCPLIHDVSFAALLADKAFDADWLLQDLDERGATAVIPPKSNRKVQRDYDTHMYKWRHLIENYFAKIKEFRWISTRYDKTDTSYAANWHLCAMLVAAR